MLSPTPPGGKAIYLRLLGYLRPYRRAFGLAIFCMIAIAATEPVFPAIMKYLLDQGFKVEHSSDVWLIPIGIVGLFFVRAILSFLNTYLMTWVASGLVTDLRRQLFARSLVLPSSVFQSESAGKISSRILYEVNNVTDMVTSMLVTAIRESFTVAALVIYLLYLDWKLTLITLAIGPVIGLIVAGFGKRMRAATRSSVSAFRQMVHTIEESVSANKVIKVFNAHAQIRDRFHVHSERFRRSMMKEAVPSSAVTPITHLAASLAVAIITYLALSRSTGQAGASAGGFVSFITAMLMLISPIKQLTTLHTTLQRGLTACEGVFELLDATTEPDQGTVPMPRVRGGIDFSNVSFQYPGAERFAIEDITFTAQPGETIAFVGSSGSGKTTLSALLPRFYEASSGTIRIDGIDISEATLQSLRENIALVSQDIVLFNDTIMANIAFGSSARASREQVIDAAKAANAWEFIEQLPEGLDTMIGEDGARLSGGQRQRIAIARALLKNAPILILDEATSALDTESERQVQAALNSLMQNRTTLIIAHRLSTIEHADRILVLDQGRIVESGTHEALLAQGGIYTNLNRLQT